MANYLLSKIMHYVKQYYLKQYTLRFLICISNKGVKSEDRIKITLLKTLKKKKIIRDLNFKCPRAQTSNLCKK